MKRQFGLVTAQHCYLRKEGGTAPDENLSGVEDEIFSGWAVELHPETETKGWVRITTHYGYSGYIRNSEMRPMTEEELRDRQDHSRFFRIGIGEADLLTIPKVQGLPLETLLKNAVAELLETDEKKEWSMVRTASGKEGYVHAPFLKERKDSDGYLLAENREGYFRKAWQERKAQMTEEEKKELRENLTASARKYLGTQYRWGGKSFQGIDCSGLAFMSHLENGILIFRDAAIREEYPVEPAAVEELQEGDLIFFPGHVAMYIGDGRYIHSTGNAKTPYVTINSLRPEDEDCRKDLIDQITGCGSVLK